MTSRPRYRVIVDNDFSGDPDDLYQLAHHVLSPSVEIPFVIGSHLSPDDGLDPSNRQAENAVIAARELLEILHSDLPVVQGSNVALADVNIPLRSEAAERIVAEAMRDDTDAPLFIALGGGLTELASAYLIEPRIAERLTAVWIGGREYDNHPLPVAPGAPEIEYNLNIDLLAAQVVFNHSPIRIWQVPRDVYRQCLVSMIEIEHRVRPLGRLGEHLAESLSRIPKLLEERGINLGETYALGDSPLVLLTALQSAFQADPSSSTSLTFPTPNITSAGAYRRREQSLA